MICGYLLKSMPGIAFSEPPLWPDCTTRIGMSGRRDPSMSASRANRYRPLWSDGLTNVTNARDSTGATTVGPVDRRLERRADESDLLAVDVGQELAAREDVIDVLEVARRRSSRSRGRRTRS